MRIALLFCLFLLSCSNYGKKKEMLKEIEVYQTIVDLSRNNEYMMTKDKHEEYLQDIKTLDSLKLEYKARYE